MADKKKEKLEHIQVKDNGIKLSQKIGDELSDAKAILENKVTRDLIQDTNKSLAEWQIRQNLKLKDFKEESSKVVKATTKKIKNDLKKDSSVNLTKKQTIEITTQMNNGLIMLQKSAVDAYRETIKKTSLTLRVEKASILKDALAKHLRSGLKIGVVYQDGKEFKFDNYWEMKARTDIQQDIGNNMVKTGQENGVIFYIAAYFGDCAKDHVDFQGKIYYDEDWESKAPKDRIDEIRDYINSKCEMSVQDVMTDKGNMFTTRPNCRHYFQYIDIDSVLGAKTNDDVNKLRAERNLNFNGKYKPEKYKALQKQRLNERNIRAEKEEVAKQEAMLALYPGDKEIQSKILRGEARIRQIQANQRELINQNSNLVRDYDREQVGIRANLGANPSQVQSIPTPQSSNETPNQNIDVEKPIVEEKPKKVSYSQDQLNAVEGYVSGDMMWINQHLRGIGEVAQYGLNDSEKAFLNNLKAATSKEIVKQDVLYRSLDASVIFGQKDSSFIDNLEQHLLYGDDSPFVMKKIGNVLDTIKGKEIVDEGFMSTTTDKVIAGQFTYYTGAEHPVVLELKVPDDNSVHGFPVYKYFEQEDEPQKEILLEPGIKFRIDSISTYQDREHDVDKQILVKATIIK